MHLTYRNVNEAFSSLVRGFHTCRFDTVSMPSRNGDVLMIPEPVIITYQKPLERVLFNRARDCNPFFHLFEALWMLAGCNDIAPLVHYNKRMAEFSDDGRTLNDAYGYRWRNAPDYSERESGRLDQLDVIANHLKANPNSRRAVLQMWNVEDDLLQIGHYEPCRMAGKGCVNGQWENGAGRSLLEAGAVCPVCQGAGQLYIQSKAVCCNTHIYFALRREIISGSADHHESAVWGYILDMTVCNRSNDLVWGMLGANVVHMSFLQEYMAARIGAEVGVYNQMTNNLHVYTWNFKPDEWLNDDTPHYYTDWLDCKRVSLVSNQAQFDTEVKQFVDNYNHEWREPFLRFVARPMCRTFEFYKSGDYTRALEECEWIDSDDWRIAAKHWIQKRAEKARQQ